MGQEEFYVKEQELIESAEKMNVGGLSIVAFLIMSMKLENFGLGDIVAVVQNFFNDEELEITQKLFNSTELWI